MVNNAPRKRVVLAAHNSAIQSHPVNVQPLAPNPTHNVPDAGDEGFGVKDDVESMAHSAAQHAEPSPELEVRLEHNEECRQQYNDWNKTSKAIPSQRKEERVLQPAMYDFINAASRGFNCRRTPITLVYSNDKCSASSLSFCASIAFSRFLSF